MKCPPCRETVQRALEEDLGEGDATSRALVPRPAMAEAAILARHACVVSGIAVAREVFRQVSPRVRVTALAKDGQSVRAGGILLCLRGPARALLAGERTALNFLQRMCGIATLTRAFVEQSGGRAAVLDTRKTTPGLRALEKYAVTCGGGRNHRFGLFDRVLIKDNHRALWARATPRPLADAVRTARKKYPRLKIEIEVENESELRDALDGRPDWVLLDNMTPARLRNCARICAGRARLEASGGVTLRTIRAIARSGVDAVSVGALTHSAPAADLSLEFCGARSCR
jgi:nicotinate-nucleotide pyrophosphorylase (carboxylating)